MWLEEKNTARWEIYEEKTKGLRDKNKRLATCQSCNALPESKPHKSERLWWEVLIRWKIKAREKKVVLTGCLIPSHDYFMFIVHVSIMPLWLTFFSNKYKCIFQFSVFHWFLWLCSPCLTLPLWMASTGSHHFQCLLWWVWDLGAHLSGS